LATVARSARFPHLASGRSSRHPQRSADSAGRCHDQPAGGSRDGTCFGPGALPAGAGSHPLRRGRGRSRQHGPRPSAHFRAKDGCLHGSPALRTGTPSGLPDRLRGRHFRPLRDDSCR